MGGKVYFTIYNKKKWERENPLSNRYNWIDKIRASEKVCLFWFVFCFWEKGIRKSKFHNWNVRLFWCSNVKKMSHKPEVKSEVRSNCASTLGIGLHDPSYQHVMPFCTNATILPFLFLWVKLVPLSSNDLWFSANSSSHYID